MNNFSSPSVSISESNVSYYIPGQTNEIAVFVGFFEKGPVNEPIFISNINDFKVIFGRGIDQFQNDWYQVYNYLQYASGIWVCRSVGNGSTNSSNSETETFVLTKDDFDEVTSTFNYKISFLDLNIDSYITFTTDLNKDNNVIDLMNDINLNALMIAKTPGESGNILSISVINNNDYKNNVSLNGIISAKSAFTFFEDGYFGICVFRNNILMETFYTNDTTTIDSNYVYISFNGTPESAFNSSIYKLSGGFSEFPSVSNIKESYDIFTDKDTYDIDIIIGNEIDNISAINVAESRRDCIAFIGLPTMYGNYLNVNVGNSESRVLYTQSGLPIMLNASKQSKKYSTGDFKNLDNYLSTIPFSEFCHFTLNIKEQINGFDNKKYFMNIAGDIAGLKSAASLSTPWTPGAGLERGIIKNMIRKGIDFNTDICDSYYKRGLNYIQNNILMTQKTYYNLESGFNRINIRSLFNHIEKNIYQNIKKYIFENNTSSLKYSISTGVKNILNDAKSKNGIYNAQIHIFDGETPNSISVDVKIQPTNISEIVILRFTNAGTNLISKIIQNS